MPDPRGKRDNSTTHTPTATDSVDTGRYRSPRAKRTRLLKKIRRFTADRSGTRTPPKPVPGLEEVEIPVKEPVEAVVAPAPAANAETIVNKAIDEAVAEIALSADVAAPVVEAAPVTEPVAEPETP